MLKVLLLSMFCAIWSTPIDALAPPTTTTPPWISPSLGARLGNPGACIYIGNRSLDTVHEFSMDGITRDIRGMHFDKLTLPSGIGRLTIKPPRITQASLSKYKYDLKPANRIWTRLFDGRLAAEGQWIFQTQGGRSTRGNYRAVIMGTEMVTNTQVARTTENKPMVQSIDCKTNFSQLRVNIDGETNMTLVDSCDSPVCEKARIFYGDAICKVLTDFVQKMINAPMATFPTRIDLDTNQLHLDYLLNSEPKMTAYGILAGLEGKINWRGANSASFNPAPLNLVDKRRMVSFGLSDYTFNTLLHQAHAHGYRYSASDLLSKSPSIQGQLSLNCSCTGSKCPRRKSTIKFIRSISCLGTLLENMTNGYQFAPGDLGDLVYKTELKSPSIFVLSDRTAYFDGGNGQLEIYGPINGNGQRKMLARAVVQLIRGDFMPKWDGHNITGSIKLTSLALDRAIIGRRTSKSSDWLSKLSLWARPVLNDMFNAFLSTHAQFPIPMVKGFKCTYPEFIVSSRTMQVDCDVCRV